MQIAQNSDRKPVQAVRRVRLTVETPKPKRRLRENLVTTAEFDKLIGDKLSEDTWRAQYRAFAFDCGFRRQYHTYRSDRSDKGFPDDVMLNVKAGRMVWIEGKRESGVLSTDQILWLDDLAAIREATGRVTGTYSPEVYVARPSDRSNLWATLSGEHTYKGLHEWCLEASCERCGKDRRRAVVVLPGGKRVRVNRKPKA